MSIQMQQLKGRFLLLWLYFTVPARDSWGKGCWFESWKWHNFNRQDLFDKRQCMAENQMNLFSGQGTPLSFKSIKKVSKALIQI